MGATVSAMAGFRWVFIATASIVLINIWQLAIALRRRRGGVEFLINNAACQRC
jgi:DHA1 family multidrug resistance protein-like MFS transporter